MTAAAMALPLPMRVHPIPLDNQTFLHDYIAKAWRNIEAEFDITLEYHRDPRAIASVGRTDSPIVKAYDFEQSHAVSHYLIIASRGNRPILTFGVAIFWLGEYDLVEYMDRFGLFSGGAGEFRFDEPALSLATGIRGRVAFAGNLWAPQDLRGGRDDTRGLIRRIGEIGRAISLATLGAEHTFLFMRDKHVRRGLNSFAQTRVPGVWWHDEMLWMAYTGQRQVKETALSYLRDAPTPASTH